jgi:hypothetical protein
MCPGSPDGNENKVRRAATVWIILQMGRAVAMDGG